MKKIIFGFILGFMLTLGINVNAAEINAQLVKIFDSSTGGNVQTFNKDSILNAKLGSESGTGDNVGGTLVLYNGGEENKRVAAGTSKIENAGIINVLDKNNKVRASMKAFDASGTPTFLLTDSEDKVITFFTLTSGYINNQKVITEDYLQENYINKIDVQKMINDAVKNALTK